MKIPSAILILAIFATVASARYYPLYKQCDAPWGTQILGTGSTTICKSGCAMSSISMILNSQSISVSGSSSNPESLNKWLTANGGYASGNLIIWGAVGKLGLSYVGQFTNTADIATYFNSGKHVILNVRNGGHWVLLTNISGTTLSVNDSGYSDTSYQISSVTRYSVYNP